MRGTGTKFIFKCSDAAKKFLLDEGIDFKYGARHLKRAIERFLVFPLSNLIATEQIIFGDLLTVDYAPEVGKLVFAKEHGGALITPDGDEPTLLELHESDHNLNAFAVAAPEARPALARIKED